MYPFSSILIDSGHSDAAQSDTITLPDESDHSGSIAADADRHSHQDDHDEPASHESLAWPPAPDATDFSTERNTPVDDVVEHAIETPPFSSDDTVADADSAAPDAAAAVPYSASSDGDAVQHHQYQSNGGSSDQVKLPKPSEDADVHRDHTADRSFVLLDTVSTNSGINR